MRPPAVTPDDPCLRGTTPSPPPRGGKATFYRRRYLHEIAPAAALLSRTARAGQGGRQGRWRRRTPRERSQSSWRRVAILLPPDSSPALPARAGMLRG